LKPGNKQSVAKGNPPNTQPRKARHRKAIPIGTGLSSTLLSSQRTTTHRKTDRQARRPALGALVQLYPRYFAASNPVTRACEAISRRFPMIQAAKNSASFLLGFGRTAAVRITPLARPFPCRLVEPYRLVSRAPNRPPATPLTRPRPKIGPTRQPGAILPSTHRAPC
jgi:hypothetical protein